ncbi:MAG: hypothetical protein ACYDAR_13995 [Thermomicrobiales bacterium]
MLLGRYRLIGTLGEGGLGTVVGAFDTRLKRTAATDPGHYRILEEPWGVR